MASEGTSTSSDKDRMEATQAAVNILAQGKRNMVCGDIPTAVNQFQEACSMLSKAYGETAKECADAYFCYGQALLDLARMENGVLGNALQGVPEDTDDDSPEQSDEQFEKADLKAEERAKLRQEVYDAMGEKETEKREREIAQMMRKDETSDQPVNDKAAEDKTENGAAVGDEVREKESSSLQDVTNQELKPEKTVEVFADMDEDMDVDEKVETGDSEKSETAGTTVVKPSEEPKLESEEEKTDKTDCKAEMTVDHVNNDNEGTSAMDMDKESDMKSSSETLDEKEMKTESTDAEKKDEGKNVEQKDQEVVPEKEPEEVSTDLKKTEEVDAKPSDLEAESGKTAEDKVEDVAMTEEQEMKEKKIEEDNKEEKTEDSKDTDTENTAEKKSEDGDKEKSEDGDKEKSEDGDKEKSEDGEEKKSEEGEEAEGSEATEEDEEGTGEDTAGDTADDVSQDDSEMAENPDDVSNLQLAWEMLELAKMIYLKDESNPAKLRVAESHLKLGEVSLETEQYEEAIKDLNSCLNIQKEVLEPDNRLLAETYCQLGLAYCFNKQFAESTESYQAAIKVIESRKQSCEKILEAATKEEKESKDFDSPVYKAQKEMDELTAILPDLKSKIEDIDDEKKNMDELKNLAKEALGTLTDGLASASAALSQQTSSSAPVPTLDISHLVKRKRKSDDASEETVKKAKPDVDSAGDAVANVNGHANKESAEPMESKS